MSETLLQISKMKKAGRGGSGKSGNRAQLSTVLETLADDLRASKIHFLWQKDALRKKMLDLRAKNAQLESIDNQDSETQLEKHFKILILNYMISNNFDERLVANLGTCSVHRSRSWSLWLLESSD